MEELLLRIIIENLGRIIGKSRLKDLKKMSSSSKIKFLREIASGILMGQQRDSLEFPFETVDPDSYDVLINDITARDFLVIEQELGTKALEMYLLFPLHFLLKEFCMVLGAVYLFH